MPANQDIAIYQGDDWTSVVTVYVEGTSTPADIAGYTAEAQIRRAVADEDDEVVVEITTVVSSPQINLSIPHSVTETLSGRYVWDLQITSPTGGITTICRGKVVVTAEVTRPVPITVAIAA